MPRIRKTLLALLAALLIGAACTQTPAATPRTDTSPAATVPTSTQQMSPDASESGGATDDAGETEDASASP